MSIKLRLVPILIFLMAVVVFPRLASSEGIESIHIETKPDGTRIISDVLIDDSSGEVFGVPQSVVADSAGVLTGESISMAGPPPNQPPVLNSRTVGPTITNTWFEASCDASDPDDPPGSLTYSWHYHCCVPAPSGATIDCPTCPNTIFRYDAQPSGTRIDVQCDVTDPQGLTTWDMGAAAAFVP